MVLQRRAVKIFLKYLQIQVGFNEASFSHLTSVRWRCQQRGQQTTQLYRSEYSYIVFCCIFRNILSLGHYYNEIRTKKDYTLALFLNSLEDKLHSGDASNAYGQLQSNTSTNLKLRSTSPTLKC